MTTGLTLSDQSSQLLGNGTKLQNMGLFGSVVSVQPGSKAEVFANF